MSAGGVVIDDHLLLRVLLGDEPPDLRPQGGRLVTTGLWYHRLCRALANSRVTGAMSRSLGDVPVPVAEAAVRAVTALPEAIHLVSMRSLAWPMGQSIASGARLNLLSLEALAAAEHLGAELCLAATDDNPPLVAAAAQRQVPLRRVETAA